MKTLIAIGLFLFAWSSTAALPRVIAGPFRNPANGHLYYLLEAATWNDSEARAVTLRGHLVTINDTTENTWVVKRFGNFGGISRPLWIGLTDRRQEGKFRWMNFEPATFTNWAPGEPNNSGGGGYEEDYVYIVQSDSEHPTLLPGKWNDVPNDGAGLDRPIYGVVEVKLNRYSR